MEYEAPIELISISSFRHLTDSIGLVIPIGVALNASASALNNSCDVNTRKIHVGDATVIKAGRKITKGDEVADFYGQHYSQADRYVTHFSISQSLWVV